MITFFGFRFMLFMVPQMCFFITSKMRLLWNLETYADFILSYLEEIRLRGTICKIYGCMPLVLISSWILFLIYNIYLESGEKIESYWHLLDVMEKFSGKLSCVRLFFLQIFMWCLTTREKLWLKTGKWKGGKSPRKEVPGSAG